MSKPHPDQSLWTRLAHADYCIFLAIFATLSLHWLTGFKALPWDAMDEFYPVSRFVAASVLSGHWPWWNPYQYAGTPLFADPQSLIFTGYTVVGVAMGEHFTPAAFGVVTLLHLAVGGVALIAYSREFSAPLLHRVLAALVFAMAGVATSRLQHIPQIVTYSYWPIALYFCYAWITRLQWRSLLGLSVVLLLIAVNPNHLTLIGGVAIGVLALLHVSARSNQRAAALLGVLLACGVSVLLASPVLSAVLEYSELSSRSALTLADSQVTSLPVFALSALLFPGSLGIGGWDRALWMPNDISENWLYVGSGATVLIAMGLMRRPSRIGLGIVLLFAFFALFAMGAHAPLYPWLYAHVPGVSLFRRPSDGAYAFMFIASLSLIHLRFATLPSSRQLLWVGLGLIVGFAAFTWLSGAASWAAQNGQWRSFVINALLGCVRLALVLLAVYWAQRNWHTRWLVAPKAVWILAALFAIEMTAPARFREFLGNSRGWAAGQIYRGAADTNEARELRALIAKLNDLGAVGNAAKYRIETSISPLGLAMPSVVQLHNTQGYSPMRIGAYHQIIGAPEPWIARRFTTHAPSYGSAWFRALGVRYVLLEGNAANNPESRASFQAAARLQHENLQSVGARTTLTLAGYELWELAMPNPPISLVSPDQLQGTAPPPHDPTRGGCELIERTADSLLARCNVTIPSVAVFSEIAFPGWYACVDGALTEIAGGWGLLRVMPMNAGEHRVSMHFEPVPFWRQRHCVAT
jgi:hypothetical protein